MPVSKRTRKGTPPFNFSIKGKILLNKSKINTTKKVKSPQAYTKIFTKEVDCQSKIVSQLIKLNQEKRSLILKNNKYRNTSQKKLKIKEIKKQVSP